MSTICSTIRHCTRPWSELHATVTSATNISGSDGSAKKVGRTRNRPPNIGPVGRQRVRVGRVRRVAQKFLHLFQATFNERRQRCPIRLAVQRIVVLQTRHLWPRCQNTKQKCCAKMTRECHVDVRIPSRTPSMLTRCARVPSASAAKSTSGWAHGASNADWIHTSFSGTFQMSFTGTHAGVPNAVDGPLRWCGATCSTPTLSTLQQLYMTRARGKHRRWCTAHIPVMRDEKKSVADVYSEGRSQI